MSACLVESARGGHLALDYHQGETACQATSLFFDNEKSLQGFLSLAGNHRFRDRIVAVRGLVRDGQTMPKPIYAVLIGLAQFTQHYVTIRKSPNARWHFDVSRGFNRDALSLVVATRNGAGIAPGADIVVNYGAHFDFGVGKNLGSDVAFKGVLDSLFERQKRLGQDPCAEDEPANKKAKQDEEKKAKDEAKQDEEAKKKKVDEAKAMEADVKKRKQEDEAKKKQEDEAKKKKQDHDEGGKTPTAEKAEATAASAASGSQADGEVIFSHSLFKLHKTASKWRMLAAMDSNKKIAKYTLVHYCGDGRVSKVSKVVASQIAIKYQITSKMLVLEKSTNQIMMLSAFVESQRPPVKLIYGCEPFSAAGVMPKGPLKTVADLTFECNAQGMAAALKDIAANLKQLQVVWAFRYDASQNQASPCGLAVITAGQIILPGKGELTLD